MFDFCEQGRSQQKCQSELILANSISRNVSECIVASVLPIDNTSQVVVLIYSRQLLKINFFLYNYCSVSGVSQCKMPDNCEAKLTLSLSELNSAERCQVFSAWTRQCCAILVRSTLKPGSIMVLLLLPFRLCFYEKQVCNREAGWQMEFLASVGCLWVFKVILMRQRAQAVLLL